MKKVHFMGIGGSGASAIASIAQDQGFEVSGCDRVPPLNDFTKHFDQSLLFEGHSPEHLHLNHRHSCDSGNPQEKTQKTDPRFRKDDEPKEHVDGRIDILAISPAITSLDPDNEELKAARELGIEVMTWQEFMGEYLEQGKFVIAVCGTHGKSTTTAMIAHVLEEAGLDPTVEIGAVVGKWGKNYRVGKSYYFVTEADEFNENFLVSHPDITVLNNLDMDHPEYYKDFEAYIDAFDKFLMQNKGTIVANLEDKNVAELLKWTMKHTSSTCIDFNKNEIQLDLKVPGEHNKKNALAAFQVGLLLGIAPAKIIEALNSFSGIGRRQELLGEKNGAKIYSDYAHHPKELKLTVEAFRAKYNEQKLIVVFQPHMFTRTKALFADFVEVFKEISAEKIIITDIFQSREKDPGDMNSQMLVDAIEKDSVIYVSLDKVGEYVENLASGDSIILFCGAGDIDKVARQWMEKVS